MTNEEYRTVNCSGPPEFVSSTMRKREVKLIKDGKGIWRPEDCPNFRMDGEMCVRNGELAYCKYVSAN